MYRPRSYLSRASQLPASRKLRSKTYGLFGLRTREWATIDPVADADSATVLPPAGPPGSGYRAVAPKRRKGLWGGSPILTYTKLLFLDFTTNTNCRCMPYQSTKTESCSARDVRKVCTKIIGLFVAFL